MKLTIHGTKEFQLYLTKQEAYDIGILDSEKTTLIGSAAVELLRNTYTQLCQSLHLPEVKMLSGRQFVSDIQEDGFCLKFVGNLDIFLQKFAEDAADDVFDIEVSRRVEPNKTAEGAVKNAEDTECTDENDNYFLMKLNNIDELFMACKLFGSKIELAYSRLYVMADHTYYLLFDSVNPAAYDKLIDYMFAEYFNESNLVDESIEFLEEHSVAIMENPACLAIL